MKIPFKYLTLLLSISITLMHLSYAKAPDYYQGKGRIAISSDGNMHDNDDMQATMLMLAIIAKAQLQDATPLYVYADHVWGSEDKDLAYMTRSAEDFGRKFGFWNTTFIAGVAYPELAYKAMAKQIAQSSEDNPLFIIAAGPMHVIGSALEIASKNNMEKLNYVSVVSHSSWNDNHSDKPDIKSVKHGTQEAKTEEPHSGWTWKEMLEVFGDKVNFVKIPNQNGSKKRESPRVKFNSWEDIAWLATHKDKNLQEMLKVAKTNPIGPDFSDAGMAYYLCANLDGVRGDKECNAIKLKAYFGDEELNINPSGLKFDFFADTGIVVGEDFIAIEAESTLSPLGKWELRDAEQSPIQGHPKASGGKYLEYMGGTISTRPIAEVEEDVLEYKFTPMTDGEYVLTGRFAQRLTIDGKKDREDLCNDIYIKMEGDFTSASNAPLQVLQSWNKFYGRGIDTWGSLNAIDVKHKHYPAKYNLKAGQEYTFKVSGRSQRFNVDYYIFVKSPFNSKARLDIAAANPIKYRPSPKYPTSVESK